MTPLQKWLLNVTVALLTITGGVFAWMKYAMTTDDPFAVANHPWQSYMLDLHVVVAPLSLFVIGIVFASHVLPKQEAGTKSRRRSGLAAMWLVAPMVLSGYFMQVLTSEKLVDGMKVIHWVSSALFAPGMLVHQLVRKNGNGVGAAKTKEPPRETW